MKKVFAILLAAMMLLSFAACGDDKDNGGSGILNGQGQQNNSTTANVVSRGTISGNTYQNAAGVKFTAPAGWSFMTDEELADVIGVGQELLGADADLAELLQSNAAIYDMGAQNATTGESVMVAFENTVLTGGKVYTEQEYLDAAAASLAAYGYELSAYTTTTLGGITYTTTTASVTMSGISMGQQLFCRAIGDYMLVISTTSTGTTSLAEMQAMFG